MRKLVTSSIVAVALAGLVAAASAGVDSSLATVTCGQTVTASVTLTADLVNCPGTGLVIGADNVTVDLGGHTIGGTNAPKSEGIADNGHRGVKILNGTITGFLANGVALRHASAASISKLAVSRIGAGGKKGLASAGILIDHSPGSSVMDSVVSNQVHAYQADGIDVLFSGGTSIQRNQLERNAWNGLVLIKSPRSQVVANHLDANGNNGMEANVGSDFVKIYTNEATGNHSWGIVAGALRRADVLGNTLANNGQDGLMFFDLQGSSIRGNRATGNANGIELAGGQHGSRHNQVSANKAAYNAHAGIWMHGDSRRSGADSNVLSGNFANHNGRGGGILVEGSAARNDLFANTANANRGRGITAVAGTIDGGSNRASENRRSPQCLGVKCR